MLVLMEIEPPCLGSFANRQTPCEKYVDGSCPVIDEILNNGANTSIGGLSVAVETSMDRHCPPSPPCQSSLRTTCHDIYVNAGGQIPCGLWSQGACRPSQSGNPEVSVHISCPVSSAYLPIGSAEEDKIHSDYNRG